MLANLNVALGLTVPLACMVGAGIFIVTVFSVNAEIIRDGFLLNAVIALALLIALYLAIRRGASRPSTEAGRVFLRIAHGLLLLSNVVAVTVVPLMTWDFLFKPPEVQPRAVIVGALAVAIPACGLLSRETTVGRG